MKIYLFLGLAVFTLVSEREGRAASLRSILCEGALYAVTIDIGSGEAVDDGFAPTEPRRRERVSEIPRRPLVPELQIEIVRETPKRKPFLPFPVVEQEPVPPNPSQAPDEVDPSRLN